MKKNCKICNNEKDLNQFARNKKCKDGHVSRCKDCQSTYYKTWRTTDSAKEISASTMDKFKNKEKIEVAEKTCNKCDVTKEVKFFTKEKASKDGYRNTCKTCRNKKINAAGVQREYARARYYEIREDVLEYQRKYSKTDHYKNLKNKRRRERYVNDSVYKTSCLLRTRTKKFIMRLSDGANYKTQEFIGCSWEEAKSYIEGQFTDGMTWDNHGEWEIDHIIPLSSAKTIDEIYNLGNYKNLQPLWREDNLDKSNKLNWKKK